MCIFSKGHHDKTEFMRVAVKPCYHEGRSYGPDFDVSRYGVEDVRHTYFRNEMVGDIKMQVYQEHYDGAGQRGCYPVTMIEYVL
jgi:hypothetical protein